MKEQADVLRNQREGQQKVIANIVAIQAWWRGVSYRAGISVGKARKGKKKRGMKGKKRPQKKGKSQ